MSSYTLAFETSEIKFGFVALWSSDFVLQTLCSFEELSRNLYIAIIQAYEGILTVSVPENVTADVAGNPNLASNVLQVRHYSLPMISTVLILFVTALFVATCLVAALLTISTASLQSAGAFPRSSATLTSNPMKNLFRIACYIQVFAFRGG